MKGAIVLAGGQRTNNLYFTYESSNVQRNAKLQHSRLVQMNQKGKALFNVRMGKRKVVNFAVL